ncbi:hypothetical protein QFZ72_004437 [Bacillus sp. V2I10]|nr:hypothetical protein [Bacillus sp. V2I10]
MTRAIESISAIIKNFIDKDPNMKNSPEEKAVFSIY